MKKPEVEKHLINALEKLLEKDGYLLKVKANERSITHKVGLYLASEFLSFDVDCEYNRDGVSSKELISLANEKITADSTEAVTVYPDIIIHQRGANKKNLLVIEAKKSNSSVKDEVDLNKLKAFKRDLKYKFAAFVKFNLSDRSFEIKWV